MMRTYVSVTWCSRPGPGTANYLDRADLRRLLDLVERDAVPGATVLACHWRHPAPDYPLTGDEVHAELALGGPGSAASRRRTSCSTSWHRVAP
jgi:hypothetical protein